MVEELARGSGVEAALSRRQGQVVSLPDIEEEYVVEHKAWAWSLHDTREKSLRMHGRVTRCGVHFGTGNLLSDHGF